MTDIFYDLENPVFPAERLLASGKFKMVSGRTSIHFAADDINIKMLSVLIMPCNQVCSLLATAKMLRKDHRAPPDIKSGERPRAQLKSVLCETPERR